MISPRWPWTTAIHITINFSRRRAILSLSRCFYGLQPAGQSCPSIAHSTTSNCCRSESTDLSTTLFIMPADCLLLISTTYPAIRQHPGGRHVMRAMCKHRTPRTMTPSHRKFQVYISLYESIRGRYCYSCSRLCDNHLLSNGCTPCKEIRIRNKFTGLLNQA
jgi:hypothetical protein